MGSAYIAKGTTVGYKYGTAGSFTPVVDLVEVTPPTYSVGEADTTTLASTARTNIPTIPDNGTCGFKSQYVTDAASIAFLQTQVTAPAIGIWQYTYADTSTETFSAWVKELNPTSDDSPEAIQEVEVTLRITGAVTFVPNPS